MAAVALLVVVVLVAVGVHSCQVSQQNSDLRNYSDGVASVVRSSNQTGQQFFNVLSSGQGASNGQNLQSQIDEARLSAENQLNRAGLSAPDPVKGGQQDLLLALQMRPRRDREHRSADPARASDHRHRRGQPDRRGDGPAVRLRRALQGLLAARDRRRSP